MSANEKILYGSPASLDVSNLHSLADGARWKSELLTKGGPSDTILVVSYSIVAAASFAADDFLRIGVAYGNGGTPEIWTGGIAEGEGKLTTVGPIAALNQALGAYQSHVGAASHGTTVAGHKVFSLRDADFMVIIGIEGNSVASTGSIVQYQTGRRQAIDVV